MGELGFHGDQGNVNVTLGIFSCKDQEREGFSIPAQLKYLREYALKNDFQIQLEFVDI